MIFRHPDEELCGFTLLELLIVVVIVAILATLGGISYNGISKKTRDTKKIQDFTEIHKALSAFYTEYNRMPANYTPGSGRCEGTPEYDQSMQELVTAGFLKSIPRSPGGGGNYCYYNYGSGNAIGAIMVTALEAAPDTTTGIPPSCRPWPPGVNWCNQNNSKAYCMCTPY